MEEDFFQMRRRLIRLPWFGRWGLMRRKSFWDGREGGIIATERKLVAECASDRH